MGDTVRARRWRNKWREQDRLVRGGTEEGAMPHEMNWSYLSEPAGTDESVWCTMGARPMRQPIAVSSLNGITNHGPWPPSSFPISDKPQHIVPIPHPAASCKLPCALILAYCSVCAPMAVFWYKSISDITGVTLDLFYCRFIVKHRTAEWAKHSSRLFNSSLDCSR